MVCPVTYRAESEASHATTGPTSVLGSPTCPSGTRAWSLGMGGGFSRWALWGAGVGAGGATHAPRPPAGPHSTAKLLAMARSAPLTTLYTGRVLLPSMPAG